MASSIYHEIMKRLDDQGLDAATVSQDAGQSPSYIRDLGRKGTKEPRRSALKKIAKELGCTVEDLTGERQLRPAVVELSDTICIDELNVNVEASVSSSDDARHIMASQDAGAVVGIHVYPAKSFNEAHGIEPGRIRIIAVRGISMQPELWPGQRVMVDIQDRTPSPGGIFVVWDGLGLVLKYIEVIHNSDPLKVRLSSAHPAFLPYECTVNEAHINGRVVGVWKRL